EASARVTLGTALAHAGRHRRGAALLPAGRLLAEQHHDLLTYGRAVHALVAASLPGLGFSAGCQLLDEALEALGRAGVARYAGQLTRLGYQHALRVGELAGAESLVWARLPIETDPLERAAFTVAAGLLALERGDDALAARILSRARADSVSS